jgi:hypothetical protein
VVSVKKPRPLAHGLQVRAPHRRLPPERQEGRCPNPAAPTGGRPKAMRSPLAASPDPLQELLAAPGHTEPDSRRAIRAGHDRRPPRPSAISSRGCSPGPGGNWRHGQRHDLRPEHRRAYFHVIVSRGDRDSLVSR